MRGFAWGYVYVDGVLAVGRGRGGVARHNAVVQSILVVKNKSVMEAGTGSVAAGKGWHSSRVTGAECPT